MRQGAARPVDPGRDFPVFSRWAAWAVLTCLFLGVFNGVFAVEVKPAAGAGEVVKLGGVEWLGIEDGLESVRQRYQPALVWYAGSSSSDGLGLLKRLESSSFRRLFSRYVLIRVTPTDLGKRYSPRPNGPRPRKAVKKKATTLTEQKFLNMNSKNLESRILAKQNIIEKLFPLFLISNKFHEHQHNI